MRGLWRELWRRPFGAAALLVLGLLYGCALLAPFLAPYPVSEQSLNHSFHPPTRLFWQEGRLHAQVYANVDLAAAQYQPVPDQSFPLKFFAEGRPYHLLGFIPLRYHLFLPDTDDPNARVYLLGSDSTGRDVFSRLLYGSQVSLSIGLIGISITLVMGFLVGGLAGYFGGRVDFLAMRTVEFLMAVPGLYLLLALRATLAPHFQSGEMYLLIVVILAFIGWAGTARVIRGLALTLRNRPFVLAAECLGQSTFNILMKHILPNLVSYLLVAATLSIPSYILGEAALSFLGLGIQEPSASWGLMLSQAQNDMKVFMLNFWWLLTPGAAIFVTVIAFNVLGDVLRDIVDPRMKV
jgi:peptide/nickel transport system permease protein